MLKQKHCGNLIDGLRVYASVKFGLLGGKRYNAIYNFITSL